MALLLLKVCLVLYVLASLLGAMELIWTHKAGEKIALVALLVAVLAHAVAFGGRTVEIQGLPVATLSDGLSVFGFLVALIALVVAWKSGVPQAAPLAACLVSGVVALAVGMESSETLPPHLRSVWLPVHIACAFLGDAAFTIAGIVSVVYLVQERRLRLKKIRTMLVGTGLHRLPALESLDAVSSTLVKLGFPLMTLGLLMGAVYSKEVRGQYWLWDPLSSVSLSVWILYAVLLHARMTIGWRGRRVALLTLIGVIVTLALFVGLGLSGFGAHGKEIS